MLHEVLGSQAARVSIGTSEADVVVNVGGVGGLFGVSLAVEQGNQSAADDTLNVNAVGVGQHRLQALLRDQGAHNNVQSNLQ